MLIPSHHGERGVWRVVNVPSIEAEDQRHLHRDMETVQQDRASTIARIKGLLRSQGLRLTCVNKLPEQLATLRLWDSSPMPSGWRQRLLRVYAHDTFLREQIAEVEAERRARLQSSQEANIEKVRQLMQLKGLGINGAWLLSHGIFWLARVEDASRGGQFSGLYANAVSQRRELLGTGHHQVGQPARALDEHGVGVELGTV